MKVKKLGKSEFTIFSPKEVFARLQSHEIVLIDVRTAAEYAFEHVAAGLLFPMSIFDPANLPCQDSKAIVFHCGSGMRSAAIAKRCADAGLARVAHMDGGFGAWKEARLPYKGIDPHTGDLVLKNG